MRQREKGTSARALAPAESRCGTWHWPGRTWHCLQTWTAAQPRCLEAAPGGWPAGTEEGGFAWLTLNYLLGHLGKKADDTVAAIDLVGAAPLPPACSGPSMMSQPHVIPQLQLHSEPIVNFACWCRETEVEGCKGMPCVHSST